MGATPMAPYDRFTSIPAVCCAQIPAIHHWLRKRDISDRLLPFLVRPGT